ncbi:MAG: S-layer homology domain-containing protein, partial [Candidatus Thalassarchaeaceae archaeon]|nr:S-layer homology domain-containing protein [Candidatus Thalassarchaeaceae archaeon]
SPTDSVTRWQMALFLTRALAPAGGTLGAGADQGFTDISGKSVEIQTAVNQIKQLGITVGKTATTFAPDDYVTREEMALFMSRLLKASQTGPGGNEEFVTGTSGAKEIKSLDADHNFSDLGAVSLMETQTAIISLWNLGVTEVIAATLYQPTINISRLNMAQMMARALDHTNARPAGLNIQGSSYSGTGSIEVTVSVTHRTADFLPIVGSLVDSFKYQHTTTAGYSRFSLDGSCAQTVATVVAVNSCYIDATDRATDSNGNIATFVEVVTAATWDIYAWTAATGTFYDNDLHGGDVGKITVIAS